LEEYLFQGEELIVRGPKPNFWRPPTDNDYGNQMPVRLGVWRDASGDQPLRKVEYWQNSDRDVELFVTVDLPTVGGVHTTSYRVWGNGEVVVTGSLSLPGRELPDLPKYGLTLHLPSAFTEVSWFGRGPFESYSDRKAGARVGLYRSPVADLFFPYIRPQETGNRTETRWLVLSGGSEVRLLVAADPVFDFSALFFTDEDLDEGDAPTYRHPWELERRDFLVLDLDLKQMGVGGDTSWGARTHPQYRLSPEDYQFRMRFLPFNPSEEDVRDLLGQRW
jgi:beta-galactosidase